MTTTLWVGETRSSPLPDPEKSWHNTMALIDSPWSRLRKPPTIPTGFTAQALNDLDDLAFAELIQAQLVPRDQDVQGRRLWDRLWKVLREDDQLADRTYNVLEQFLDTTEDALEDGGLDEAGTKRAEKFKQQCEMSWKRIDRGRDRDGALGWAGEHATAHPPQSRRVIAALIGAIARHRAEVLREFGKPNAADAELWDVMAHLGLDPRDYETRDS
mgnify:FL=1